jgi:hypothetical protein
MTEAKAARPSNAAKLAFHRARHRVKPGERVPSDRKRVAGAGKAGAQRISPRCAAVRLPNPSGQAMAARCWRVAERCLLPVQPGT